MTKSDARRLLLESFVIVASILAAFALDRWWEDTQDRSEERITLSALKAEFVEARTSLERIHDLEQRVLNSVEFVRDSLAGALTRGSAMAMLPDTALGWLYVPPTTQLVLGTRDGLIQSDRLTVLRSRELRVALGAWGSLLADMNEEEWSSRDLVFTDLDRVFRVRANVEPFRSISTQTLNGTLSEERSSGVSAVRVDQEIVGVVATRYAIAAHGLDQFEPVFKEIDYILGLIEASANN